jgi:phosphoribosyl 1,2-cyclic phosphodiesterase
MHVRFWGTRGSIAKPGQTTLRYGGNTSCVEVRADDGTLVVLDCGTGAHGLGQVLATEGDDQRHGHLLIGHTHWDHIQGFPFFVPLFDPNNRWDIYAPGSRSRHLETTLVKLMSNEFFPLALHNLSADIRFHDLMEGRFEVGSIQVTTQYLNHPTLTLGYRLEVDGVRLVYATDHEPHTFDPAGALPGAAPLHHEDGRHIRFLEGADLVIHDTQYTLADFPDRLGWGHSPVERAVDFALLADAKQLALFHHDPNRHDDAIDQVCAAAQARARTVRGDLKVFAAAEGQTITLSRSAAPVPDPSGPISSALRAPSVLEPLTVLVADADPAMRQRLEATLKAEGAHVLSAADGKTAYQLTCRERPALMFLDAKLPGYNGLTVCRMLRRLDDPYLRSIPLVVMTQPTRQKSALAKAFQAGATDYIIKSCKPALLHARVCTWLLRARAEG